MQSRVTSRVKEVILPVCSAFLRSHLEHCTQVQGPQHKDLDGSAEESPEEDYEDEQRAGAPLLWKQAERVGLLSLEKRSLLGQLTEPPSA